MYDTVTLFCTFVGLLSLAAVVINLSIARIRMHIHLSSCYMVKKNASVNCDQAAILLADHRAKLRLKIDDLIDRNERFYDVVPMPSGGPKQDSPVCNLNTR